MAAMTTRTTRKQAAIVIIIMGERFLSTFGVVGLNSDTDPLDLPQLCPFIILIAVKDFSLTF